MEEYPILHKSAQHFEGVAVAGMTLAMVAIVLSLLLYHFLSAANLSGADDRLLKEWIKDHYVLIIIELLFTILSVVLLWFNLYFLGLMRFKGVNYNTYGLSGIACVGSIIVAFLYMTIVHFTRTIPRIKKDVLHNVSNVNSPLVESAMVLNADGSRRVMPM
jgi:hypothetical protein